MGWDMEDAQAHTCIAGVCGIVVTEHLSRKSNKFAATTHALCDALARSARKQRKIPPVTYGLLYGQFGGLVKTTDARYADLLQPDANGFRGFTCVGETTAFSVRRRPPCPAPPRTVQRRGP